MKKYIIYLLSFVLLLGFVSAVGQNENVSDKGKSNLETIDAISKGEIQNKSLEEDKGVLTNEQEKVQTRNQIKIGDSFLNCSENCNYTILREQNQEKIQVTLSNGKNAQIKVMPETASKTAIERLQLKSCNESNCTIELKEVGKDNSTKLAYQVNTTKEARFLGLFKSNVKIETQIDAETGEIISIKKPWWVSI